MNKYQEQLEVMCKRCINHEMCQGTGCKPKNDLQELIDENKDSVIKTIEEQPKVGEWIPCSERLPKITDDYVLITMEKYYSKELCIEIGYIEDGKWKFALTDKYIKSKVIAWCELPKPYKGD